MRAEECSQEQAAQLLRPVLGSKPNPIGSLDMGALVDGRCYWVKNDAGELIGAYVLRGHDREIWIQAAAGCAHVDLCDLFDELIPKHGPGFASIGFKTYRRGLVKKARQRGYVVEHEENGCYTMRKFLK